jgi:hypothetical protein
MLVVVGYSVLDFLSLSRLLDDGRLCVFGGNFVRTLPPCSLEQGSSETLIMGKGTTMKFCEMDGFDEQDIIREPMRYILIVSKLAFSINRNEYKRQLWYNPSDSGVIDGTTEESFSHGCIHHDRDGGTHEVRVHRAAHLSAIPILPQVSQG